MYHPTTRVLAVLELLQSRGRLTGPELAERLEVDLRTVRRYVTMLQDLGIPVEGERGRAGGYRLMPGFKLPPLMLNDEEALAVTLGLIAARRMGLASTAPAVEGALAKIERVLPPPLRSRLAAVQEALVFDLPISTDAPAAFSVVLELSEATRIRHRVWLSYADTKGVRTDREFDPYGLAFVSGRWYTTGHCHLRNALRVFRIDRIVDVELREAGFIYPTGFDPLAYVQATLATSPGIWHVEVVLRGTMDEAREMIPPTLATLEAIDRGVLFTCRTDDLEYLARRLVRAGIPLAVRTPDALREALHAVAAETTSWADALEEPVA